MRNYREKCECSVVCAYGYGRPFAEFNQKVPFGCSMGPREFYQNGK